MGRWTGLFIHLFGSVITMGGIGAMTMGLKGFVGGLMLLVSGLLMMPATRPLLSKGVAYIGGPDLQNVGTLAIAIIVITGLVAGFSIVPQQDSQQAATVPDDTETPTASPEAKPTSTPDSTSTPTSTPTSGETNTQPPTPGPTDTPTSTPNSGGTNTQPPTPTPTDTPTPTAEPSDSLEDGLTVSIVDVIDGDTMDVRFPNGTVETIRLLGVDTPETSVTQVSPDEWEDIPDSTDGRDWLTNWGDEATSFAEDRLAGEEVVIEADPESDRRGYYGRLLVYVSQSESSETSFNMRLIKNGYARYYSSSFSMSNEYQSAESDARSSNNGVWDYSEPDTPTPTEADSSGSPDDIVVASIHADAEGNDHENLNDEYIVLRNSGDSTIDMGGWTLSDEADHTYYFPTGFELGPGETVTIYTGSGSDSDGKLYWGSSSAVWNNGGDTIILETDGGERVISYEY